MKCNGFTNAIKLMLKREYKFLGGDKIQGMCLAPSACVPDIGFFDSSETNTKFAKFKTDIVRHVA
jgi:hypothetical protein